MIEIFDIAVILQAFGACFIAILICYFLFLFIRCCCRPIKFETKSVESVEPVKPSEKPTITTFNPEIDLNAERLVSAEKYNQLLLKNFDLVRMYNEVLERALTVEFLLKEAHVKFTPLHYSLRFKRKTYENHYPLATTPVNERYFKSLSKVNGRLSNKFASLVSAAENLESLLKSNNINF